MRNRLNLALVQATSVVDRDANLERVRYALSTPRAPCDLVVFPENVLCLGGDESVRAAARPIDVLDAELGGAAADAGQWVVFGGVPVLEDTGRVRNASLVYRADGRRQARYDKMHLFRFSPGAGHGIDETKIYEAGAQPQAFLLDDWRIGLTICYDLRFPELFRAYVPADLILCTAAFTATTGRAHWDLLLRARAVENQCYVAGVGQGGMNAETGVALFGHSLLADPWGTVVASTPGADAQVLTASLERTVIASVRQRLPALEHRHGCLGAQS